ncbi:UPF0146 family protein [Haloarchaeobius sp. HME9146]|uniref:UPF0146 family protein n=1 Tax=Haloarchaeobius sp. HME9146 TaxID=2978732 RepID=UPI0021C0B4BD|nr:UPF0146 family protein [Haloarchaeobius sp. HME9146]
MVTDSTPGLCGWLAKYEAVVEVGIGNRTDVAACLAERGVRVTATDIHDRSVPEGVRFVRDDVTAPDLDVYRDAEVLYALNLPPELHRPVWDVAKRVGADFVFTTLGGDQPAIPVDRETIPGDTLYLARAGPGR